MDDESVILDALKNQLSKHFSKEAIIEMVESGQEALDLIDELVKNGREISLVISDQLMPKMKGDEFLIEAHKRIPKTNKILLTGNADNHGLFSLVNQINLYRYIPKPWEETDLHLTVSEALNAYDRERDLERKNEELYNLNVNLEDKVNERTTQLGKKTDQLQGIVLELNTAQNKLIESEKLASLGQLMAGIAHEINTPLGAINASAGSLLDSFWGCLSSLTKVIKKLSEGQAELFFEMIKQGATSKTVLSTKEARAKRREITLTLAKWDVSDAAQLADKLVDMNILENLAIYRDLICHYDSEVIISSAFHLINQTKTTKNIEIAVKKANKIVYALKSYSRFNQIDEKIEVDLRENIETVLVLYHNQIKQGIDVTKNFDNGSLRVHCFPDELIQVWTNIIHNSIHAMKNNGELTIDLHENGKSVKVSISDNGPGIPEEIQPKIFNAFFTTKPTGEGSGLGLDIAKKIIEKHQGTIDFKSDREGTTFNIILPK